MKERKVKLLQTDVVIGKFLRYRTIRQGITLLFDDSSFCIRRGQ